MRCELDIPQKERLGCQLELLNGDFIELIQIGFNFFDSSIVWVDIRHQIRPGPLVPALVKIYL